MIHLFTKSLRFFLCASGVTLLLVLLFIFLSNDFATALLLLIVGGWVSWFGAQYIAITAHQKLLAILYQQMQPDRFLEGYLPLLERCRKENALRAALRAQIGNAYAAKGQFDTALEYFFPEGKSVDTRLMQAQNRCSCYLWKEDVSLARAELARLEELELELSSRNKLTALANAVKTLTIRLRALSGSLSEEEIDWLREESSHTNKPLYRSNIRFLLAQAYARRGQTQLSRNFLENIVEEGGDIWVVQQAKERLL